MNLAACFCTWCHVTCLGMKEEVYLPYTHPDVTFTCFSCDIPNFSSKLFDTVSGHRIISYSSASFNISDISSISNWTLGSESSRLEQDERRPLCSSPSKKCPRKLPTRNGRFSSQHTKCYEYQEETKLLDLPLACRHRHHPWMRNLAKPLSRRLRYYREIVHIMSTGKIDQTAMVDHYYWLRATSSASQLTSIQTVTSYSSSPTHKLLL